MRHEATLLMIAMACGDEPAPSASSPARPDPSSITADLLFADGTSVPLTTLSCRYTRVRGYLEGDVEFGFTFSNDADQSLSVGLWTQDPASSPVNSSDVGVSVTDGDASFHFTSFAETDGVELTLDSTTVANGIISLAGTVDIAALRLTGGDGARELAPMSLPIDCAARVDTTEIE